MFTKLGLHGVFAQSYSFIYITDLSSILTWMAGDRTTLWSLVDLEYIWIAHQRPVEWSIDYESAWIANERGAGWTVP